jgi:glycosyltransferase involved in cell wall biosynthesis
MHVITGLEAVSGGPPKVLPEMCAALARRGHDVELVTTKWPGDAEPIAPAEAQRAGYRLRYFERRARTSVGVSAPVWRALREDIPACDVVEIHSLYLFPSLVAGHEARRRGVPYVVRPHGTLHPSQRSHHRGRKRLYDLAFERRQLNRAAGIHYTSEQERSYTEAAGIRAPAFVVPHGVDLPDLDDAPPRDHLVRRYPEWAGRQLVTYLGRLSRRKRPDVLIDAFARVRGDHPDAHLVIAGPDEEGLRAEYERQAATLGIADRCSFPGLVVGADKAALLRWSTVFVLPSEWENFGLSVAEAMTWSLPVVITPGVDLAEHVTESGGGLVVEPTAAGVAPALDRLLGDPDAARAMGARARERARTAFAWEAVAERLEAMYAAVTRGGRV